MGRWYCFLIPKGVKYGLVPINDPLAAAAIYIALTPYTEFRNASEISRPS